MKMASPEKKAQCVAWFIETKSDIQRQRNYLTKYVENVVYRTKVQNVVELKQRIQAAIETDDKGMLQRSWMELEYRLYIIRAKKGSHVKFY
ncbi:hypothetical protein AVEN_138663-1 [Araneus ventricosus]|uniref:Uncharacterized protein n=1 Tax=Araneus ventricosus TaxID=182803 RepID=A0A4Y2NJW3_ARAVE|nr:hypothetical protein AVEN_138663-1 [Araneus ventricosus]